MGIASRDSIHMFKMGVKPRWEDPRNKQGGSLFLVRMLLTRVQGHGYFVFRGNSQLISLFMLYFY